MNKAVYLFLLKHYATRPGIIFGFLGELVRTLCLRVFTIIVMAHAISSLNAHDFEAAKLDALVYIAVYLLGSVVGVIGDLLAVRGENAQYEYHLRSFHQRLTNKDIAFYRDHQTGYLTSLFRQHTDSILLLVRLLRSEGLRNIISMIVPTIILLVADWRIGVVAVCIVILQLLYITWASKKSHKWRKLSHEIYRKLTGEVADEITNIVAFKSGGHEKQSQDKVAALAAQETNTFWLRRKSVVLLDFPRNVLTGIGVAFAFYLAIDSATHNPSSISMVALTLIYIFQIVRSVNELPNLIISHDDLVTKAYPTLEYLGDAHHTVIDPKHPKKLAIKKGAVAFKNVDFHYPAPGNKQRHITVFQNFTLTIEGGQQVGIVGLSGAGKSTLASLVMRFDDVSGGAVTIDKTDIREVRQSDLRQSIAYVPQEPLLFHRSIRENIAYFKQGATEEEIIKAAKAAHAHEFISRLPEGYDTIVGERGVKLSGGQKQRVVIARIILKNAPIMIFDEATSALDSESEQIIQRALPKIIGKHTAIVIAHRLSTVAGLDRIIVMHNGKIIEDGTHEELLALRGRYYSLWQKQTVNES